MIEAKLAGQNLDDADAGIEPDEGNVIDLMAALRKSLGVLAPERAKPAARQS